MIIIIITLFVHVLVTIYIMIQIPSLWVQNLILSTYNLLILFSLLHMMTIKKIMQTKWRIFTFINLYSLLSSMYQQMPIKKRIFITYHLPILMVLLSLDRRWISLNLIMEEEHNHFIELSPEEISLSLENPEATFSILNLTL